eukprot:scaffold23424_cov121-Isochrysis_galbana.AAC.1
MLRVNPKPTAGACSGRLAGSVKAGQLHLDGIAEVSRRDGHAADALLLDRNLDTFHGHLGGGPSRGAGFEEALPEKKYRRRAKIPCSEGIRSREDI